MKKETKVAREKNVSVHSLVSDLGRHMVILCIYILLEIGQKGYMHREKNVQMFRWLC